MNRHVQITLLSIFLIVALCASNVLAIASSAGDFTVTQISQSPNPVEPGQVVTVKFTLENNGAETKDTVSARLNLQYPLSLYSGTEEINLGRLRASSSAADLVEFEYKLKVDQGASEGTVDLDLEVLDPKGSGVRYNSGEFSIEVQTNDALLDIHSISAVPAQVAPGEVSQVTVTVKNNDDSLLRDITFKLDLEDSDVPFAPYQGASQKRIGQLDSGFQNSLVFDLIADPSATAGLYKIPIQLSYTDENGNELEREDTLALSIGGSPRLRASISKSSVVQRSSQGLVTIEIANSGATDVKRLELEMGDSKDYELIATRNVFYLGDIDSDDTESEEFSIYVTRKAKSSASIPITLRYSDANNQGYEQSAILELPLYSSSQVRRYGLKEQSGFTGVLIVLLILAGAGYYWYRKKNPKNA